jgi:beta-galactosidase
MKRHSIAEAARGWQHSSILFGCDYNPEQWSESVWQADVELMVEAGVGLVAINIFGWASIEPSEGIFDFAALDKIIALLHSRGIRINLGTGTSSAPPWLSAKYPEILPQSIDGTTRFPGGRQAHCPSSPVFRERALALVERVAERYGSHPAVALWHVSNELGCHNALCYCDVSAEAFRRWLETRYESIDSLNQAWGTTFWSQHYGDWAEILPPRLTLSTTNPAHKLDFSRFSSDELLDYYRSEADVVRAVSAIPVTTNFMVTAHIRNMDYWQWAGDMDIVANDHYLDNRLARPQSELSFAADLTRGLAAGNPWILMESSTSAVSWQPHNVAKRPGELILNSLTQVARGADGICFFQWRASRQGAEKFHSALLPHAGTDSKIWRDTLELGRVLRSIAEVAETRVEANIAMVFSWQSWWAAEGDSQPSSAVRYLEQVHAGYEALRSNGVTVDIVAPGADLSGYAVVLIPCLYLLTDAEAAVISDYTASGGTVVVTFFSGLVDNDDRLRVDPAGQKRPGAFSDLLGAWTEEFFPLLPEQGVTLSSGATGTIWTELVRIETAVALASFRDGPVAGSPAVTTNSFGAGRAVYIATDLAAADYSALLGTILLDAGVQVAALPAGVELVVRSNEEFRYTFVINHSDADASIWLDGGVELTMGEAVSVSVNVPGGSARVIRQPVAVPLHNTTMERQHSDA